MLRSCIVTDAGIDRMSYSCRTHIGTRLCHCVPLLVSLAMSSLGCACRPPLASSGRSVQDGLPLVYNEERIAEFWKTRPGELASRWARFARIAVPWLTGLANSFLRGTLERDQRGIAKKAVDNLEKLGPTFIKLGQILSIRPDVLPPAIMQELGKLQVRTHSHATHVPADYSIEFARGTVSRMRNTHGYLWCNYPFWRGRTVYLQYDTRACVAERAGQDRVVLYN